MGSFLHLLLLVPFLQGYFGQVRSTDFRGKATNDYRFQGTEELPRVLSEDCATAASPPVAVDVWPNAAVNMIPADSDWIFNIKFDQNVLLGQVTSAYIKFYYSSGRWTFSIPGWNLYNINFPAPDTLQVVVPNHLLENMVAGQEYYVLLDEGVVTGPRPCYLPSVAVDDPYFYRVFYGHLPSTTEAATTPPSPVDCASVASPPVAVGVWPNATINTIPADSSWAFRIKFDQNVMSRVSPSAYIYFYSASSGRWTVGIPGWNPGYNFPTPDTLEVVIPQTERLHLPLGQEYYVLLDEGVVTGPDPCYLPSVAVDDPYFFRVVYGHFPSTDESPIATTPADYCSSVVSPPLAFHVWPNATVNRIPADSKWIFNIRFDQNVTLGQVIPGVPEPRIRIIRSSSGPGWSFGIHVSYPDFVNFPSPDTLQVTFTDFLQGHIPLGYEYYVLLDEGVVRGPDPCHLPSAAVNDPYFYRVVFDDHLRTTAGARTYSTEEWGDWITTSSDITIRNLPTEGATEPVEVTSPSRVITTPPLLPSMDCSVSGMAVFIPRSVIGDALASHLHFLDPACVGRHHNATHIKIATTYDRCGTFMEVRGDNVIFFNVIHDEAVPVEPGGVITRDRDIEIPVQCIMDLEGMAELSFRPDTSKITYYEEEFGSFNFSLGLYRTNDYATPYLPADYPVDFKMGDTLYFEARTWSEPGLELFLQTCRATPTSNSTDFHRYTFIQNGCIKDYTLVFHPSYDPHVQRFQVEVFAFMDTLPQPVVYVHCDMILCNASDPDSRCAVGCPAGDVRSQLNMHKRHARSTMSGSHVYPITQGPISLAKEGGKEASSGSSSVQQPILLTTVCLSVGCVLVLGTLVALMKKRSKRIGMYAPLALNDPE